MKESGSGSVSLKIITDQHQNPGGQKTYGPYGSEFKTVLTSMFVAPKKEGKNNTRTDMDLTKEDIFL
jgi:hypothetical protein